MELLDSGEAVDDKLAETEIGAEWGGSGGGSRIGHASVMSQFLRSPPQKQSLFSQ